MVPAIFAFNASTPCARTISAAKLADISPTLAALEPSSVVILVSNTLPTSAADAVAAFPAIFKLVTGVVEVTINGAVPVATVDLTTFAEAVPPTLISWATPIPPRVVIEPVFAFTEAV